MSVLSAARERVIVQVKSSTPGASGTISSWADVPAGERWAAVIPLDVRTRASLGSLRGEITHTVAFRGKADVRYGRNRLRWGARVLELSEPPQERDGNTVVAVREAS